MDLAPNLAEALRFLQAYDEDLNITFQVFDDTKKTNQAKHFTGNFENLQDSLKSLNDSGNGIYFMINRGDGRGRSAENVTHIRALTVDLDGAPLGPILECKLPPHFIIESSPGRYQAHWLIDPIEINGDRDGAKKKFASWQVALAKKFGGDESVKDLSRVFRIPGFYHQKKEPFLSKVIESSQGLPYNIQTLIDTFGLNQSIEEIEAKLRKPLPPISELIKTKWRPSERHEGLTKFAWKYIQRGLSPQESLWLLQEVNKKICEPPLDRPNELEDLVRSAYKKKEPQEAIHFVGSEWLALPEVPANPILEGIFDKGDKTTILGKSKTRKSFFAQQLAFCLVTGQPFLSFAVPIRRKVLLIQSEIKKDRYHARCVRMADALGILPELLESLIVVNARGLSNLSAVIEAQAALHSPDVIIIDPFYKLIDGDENKSEDVKPILKMFDTLAEKSGAAIVYLHHDKKGSVGEMDLSDRGSGSGVVGRDFDSSIMLSPHKTEEDSLVIEFITRNYASPAAIAVDWLNYHFSVSGLAPEKKTLRSTAQGVRSKLSELVERAQKLITEEYDTGKRSFAMSVFRAFLEDSGIHKNIASAVIEKLAENNSIEVVSESRKGIGGVSKRVLLLDPVLAGAENEEEIPF